MTSHRIYQNPPIEEALCEFRFSPNQAWDLTIPGKVHVRLSPEYRGKPQEQNVVGIELTPQAGQKPNLNFAQGLARVQLPTEDGKRMVAVGQNILSVHMLHPYYDPQLAGTSGWEEFKSRIIAGLKAYWDVVQPNGVNRVGIRYINKIIIPKNFIRIEDYLRCSLPDVSGLPDGLNNFICRAEYSYDDDIRLVLSHGTTTAPQDHLGLLLDLDVIWESSELIDLCEAIETAEMLRDRERSAFEAVITDQSRELFDVR